jgi:hypothetical protein
MAIDIKSEMAAFDTKDRNFIDNLTEEDRKKFSTYLMLRWGASVAGSEELQAYYLMATNERVNKNFFDLAKHPKLQWLLCTTVSPAMGKQYHYWLAAKKKTGDNKIQNFLAKTFPNMKTDEIELLAKLNDTKDIKELAKELGLSNEQIKKEL